MECVASGEALLIRIRTKSFLLFFFLRFVLRHEKNILLQYFVLRTEGKDVPQNWGLGIMMSAPMMMTGKDGVLT